MSTEQSAAPALDELAEEYAKDTAIGLKLNGSYQSFVRGRIREAIGKAVAMKRDEHNAKVCQIMGKLQAAEAERDSLQSELSDAVKQVGAEQLMGGRYRAALAKICELPVTVRGIRMAKKIASNAILAESLTSASLDSVNDAE